MAEPFRLVETPDADTTPSPSHRAATTALILSLKVLSQRALIALADLFSLITSLTVFWMALAIHEPNTYQLVQLGGYALFVLAINIVVRRK